MKPAAFPPSDLSPQELLALKLSDLSARGFGRNRIKALVNQGHWDIVGKLFNFTPVFHVGTSKFLDWRCVPSTLIDYLKATKPPKPSKPSKPQIRMEPKANSRVNQRKYIKSLMLAGAWDELFASYGFRVRFVDMPNGKHVIDWDSISGELYRILLCGGSIKRTLYTKEGGIYDPFQRPPIPPGTPKEHRSGLLPRAQRTPHFKLEDRQPLRIRLHESQKGICYWCKQFTPQGRDWTIEHLKPRSLGGTNDDDNVVGCCWKCNVAKDCMTPEEFMASPYYLNLVFPKIESQPPAK